MAMCTKDKVIYTKYSKLAFPTGRDSATFWDKGIEVPSGQPNSRTGRDVGQNGTEQKKMF